jgi:hypothetical protein
MNGYGAFAQINASFSMEDCIISNIHQTNTGVTRAVFRFNTTTATTLSFNRCQFINCSGDDSGVIARNSGTHTLVMSNCIVRGTTKKPFIAGGNINATITNCNFIDNAAGAITSATSATCITNSIFYNSTIAGSGTLNYSYYNGTIGSFTASNSTSFTDAGDVFADLTDYYPAAGFAGIDHGDNSVSIGATDIAGNPRAYGTMDIGAYENIEITNYTAGTNITSLSAYGLYGSTSIIASLTTTDFDYVPDAISGVTFIQVSGADYTATVTNSVPVTKTADVDPVTFTATQETLYTVTVSYPSQITLVSPTLTNVSTVAGITTGTYKSPSSSSLYITVDNGYDPDYDWYPFVLARRILHHLGGDSYRVDLSVTEDMTVAFIATIKQYEITYVTTDGVTVTSPTTVDHGDNLNVSFTLDQGYHDAWATIDGVLQTVSNSAFTVAAVTDNITVYLGAYPKNEIPVAADKAIAGNNSGAGYADDAQPLMIQNANNRWALLKFTLPTYLSDYSKVILKLTSQSEGWSIGSQDMIADVREAPEEIATSYPDLDVTYSQSSTKGTNIITTFTIPTTAAEGDTYEIDITDYVLGKSGDIFLQLTDNNIVGTTNTLYSQEFAAKINDLNKVAKLILSDEVNEPVALPAVITKDPVVKTEYYNLQGIRYSISQRNRISAGTPYIVKQTHQSGKVVSKVVSD